MPIKCGAKIAREFKTKKASIMWPETTYGHNFKADSLPLCGGDVTFEIRVSGCSCSGPDLMVEAICSRCTHPFYRGALMDPYSLLTEALVEYTAKPSVL